MPSSKIAKLPVLVDSLVVKRAMKIKIRAADSVQTAFSEGHGECIMEFSTGD